MSPSPPVLTTMVLGHNHSIEEDRLNLLKNVADELSAHLEFIDRNTPPAQDTANQVGLLFMCHQAILYSLMRYWMRRPAGGLSAIVFFQVKVAVQRMATVRQGTAPDAAQNAVDQLFTAIRRLLCEAIEMEEGEFDFDLARIHGAHARFVDWSRCADCLGAFLLQQAANDLHPRFESKTISVLAHTAILDDKLHLVRIVNALSTGIARAGLNATVVGGVCSALQLIKLADREQETTEDEWDKRADRLTDAVEELARR